MLLQTQHDARLGSRPGVAAVELAVLAPFLVFLFVIAVDFSRIFYFTQVIENCARKGALYLSDPKAPANNLYANVQQAALGPDSTPLSPQPTVTSGNGTDAAGNAYVSATVTWTFSTITKFPGVPSSLTISRTVQMRSAP
jgi:Flp pilus assembly protein TadG